MGTDPAAPQNPILSHIQVAPLLAAEALAVMSISLDLGRSTAEVQRTDLGWVLPDGEVLSFAQLEHIYSDQNGCFRLINSKLHKVEAYSPRTDRYYSLMPTANAPTMLISGIPMHRIKDTTPAEDTKQKLRAIGKAHGCILDTATGLGYTALMAALTADMVITIEYDPAVHEMCRLNPWSAELFNKPNIQPVIGDSADLVAAFSENSFNAVIHDPPTFALAGQLYSGEMYRHLYRILKPNGRLFHYIGNPNSHYGATTERGVVTRLRRAGFRVTPEEKAFGVLAVK